MDIIKIIAEQFDHWAANPVATILALGVGIVIGLWLGKNRYQGAVDGHKAQIDALKERIENREDQIATKDDAIRSLGEDLERARKSALGVYVGRQKTRDKARAPQARLYTSEEERLRDVLTRTTYKFVFNPAADASKILSFLPDGTIGQGRNENENRWRITNDQLEILNSAGYVFSRFNLLDDLQSFHHTNENDLHSLRGQYMHPISMVPDKPDIFS
jgi:hypothetical protein